MTYEPCRDCLGTRTVTHRVITVLPAQRVRHVTERCPTCRGSGRRPAPTKFAPYAPLTVEPGVRA